MINEYIKYSGDYKKIHYDIITKCGNRYDMRWPNCGDFYYQNKICILGHFVDRYGISHNHPLDFI